MHTIFTINTNSLIKSFRLHIKWSSENYWVLMLVLNLWTSAANIQTLAKKPTEFYFTFNLSIRRSSRQTGRAMKPGTINSYIQNCRKFGPQTVGRKMRIISIFILLVQICSWIVRFGDYRYSQERRHYIKLWYICDLLFNRWI